MQFQASAQRQFLQQAVDEGRADAPATQCGLDVEFVEHGQRPVEIDCGSQRDQRMPDLAVSVPRDDGETLVSCQHGLQAPCNHRNRWASRIEFPIEVRLQAGQVQAVLRSRKQGIVRVHTESMLRLAPRTPEPAAPQRPG